MPLLKDPDQEWATGAIGRYRVGDTIRTDRYRYSEYTDPRGKVLSRMLYDHQHDPAENTNISEAAKNQALVKELSRELNARMGKPLKK